MKRLSLRAGIAASVLTVLLLSACGKTISDEHTIEDPASFEDGRVTMTEQAEQRLDIQTTAITSIDGRLVVPSSALIVDPEGVFWVYTSPEPLVFVRERIRVARDEGERAFLTSGPPAGTEVVTVGVPELYGIEYEVGH